MKNSFTTISREDIEAFEKTKLETENLAIFSALAAYKYYCWKGEILTAIPDTCEKKFSFPATDFPGILFESIKRFRPDLYRKFMPCSQAELFFQVEKEITPLRFERTKIEY